MTRLVALAFVAAVLIVASVHPGLTQNKVAQDKGTQDRAAQDKVAQDKVAQDKGAQDKPLTAQQQKMKDCAIKWKEEKAKTHVSGREAYRTFLGSCMKSGAA
jgi:hypothetical protein